MCSSDLLLNKTKYKKLQLLVATKRYINAMNCASTTLHLLTHIIAHDIFVFNKVINKRNDCEYKCDPHDDLC